MDNKFTIKCRDGAYLAAGYTKIKVFPQNYSKLILVASITGKNLQEVTDELLAQALNNLQIEKLDGSIIDIKL